ncbi:hypothetical protein C8Q78DRAFT_966488 [Trametes maxima]|nr:hypothetical protein C8Q78DRAFT_966488 [Trametes maxima]
MPILLVSTLATPLLKIPLLLSHALCTYQGMTPPRPPPPTEDQKRFAVPDYMTRTTATQMAITAAAKWALCGLAVAEAGSLLVRSFPSLTSDRILSLLFPSNAADRVTALRITTTSAAACVLGIMGGLIRIWCHRTLGRLFTWQMAVQRNHELVTTGPYAYVRHPSYAGWVLMVTGNFALLFQKGSYFVEADWWSRVTGKLLAVCIVGYLTFVTISLLRRMAKEDTVLRNEFGAKWEDWSKKTPYRLIPYVY